MAAGQAAADATRSSWWRRRASTTYGICSTPFLDHAFRTAEFRIKVTINADGTWGYDEDTVLHDPRARTSRSTTPTATR